ncbi:MAG: diguanylate cyclase domain-containing protein, partial [Alphaproteobacteria bacterium]
MVRLPDFGASTSAAPQDDQSAAVLDWLGAAVPGFVLFRLRADGTLASVSEGWSEATGLPASATIGRRLIDLVHPDDRQRVGRLLEPKDAPATSETDLRITGADGRERQLVAVRGPDLSGEGGRDVVGMLRDVFADRAIERQLAAAYSYDMLTAVPNRTLFLDRLGEAVRAARATGEGLALLVCDIDRFRALNETAGHRPADELLRIVARRLERQVRGGDTIGRIGADEFGVIQTGVRSLDDVRSLADRLAFVLSKPYRAEGIRLRASCSVGVAVLAAEGGVESLLSDAHLALNQAKRVGRGQVRFADPAVGGAERERLSLEEDLLQAIDEAGLTLHFQPFV